VHFGTILSDCVASWERGGVLPVPSPIAAHKTTRISQHGLHTVYYASVRLRRNTQWTVLRRIYFMAVIEGEFCLKMGAAVHRPSQVSVTTIEWSEIVDSYNTSGIVGEVGNKNGS